MKENRQQGQKVLTTRQNSKIKTKTAGNTKTKPTLVDPRPKK